MSAVSPLPPPGRLRTLALATLVNTLGTGLWVTGSALFLTRAVGLSPASVGLGLTVAGLIGPTASVPLGGLADRLDPRTLRAVLQLTQAVVAAAYLLVDSFPVFLLVATLDAVLLVNTVLTVLLAVRLSRGAAQALPAAATMRRAGLVLGAAMLLWAATADLPATAAVGLLLVGAVVYTLGDLWHAGAGAALAYNLAAPDALGAYQGVDGLLAGLARAVGPAVLTWVVLDGGAIGWLALAGLLALTGLAVPPLTRHALSHGAGAPRRRW